MTTVTIADFEAGVAHYVELARSGEEVVVAEHGEAVARLAPPADAAVRVRRFPNVSTEEKERLSRMERKGVIRLGRPLPPDFWALPDPEDPDGLVMRALLEEREEGR